MDGQDGWADDGGKGAKANRIGIEIEIEIEVTMIWMKRDIYMTSA